MLLFGISFHNFGFLDEKQYFALFKAHHVSEKFRFEKLCSELLMISKNISSVSQLLNVCIKLKCW